MVKIVFATDNASFHEATHDSFGGEVARILRKLADLAEHMDGDPLDNYSINDVNGNKIGSMTTTYD